MAEKLFFFMRSYFSLLIIALFFITSSAFAGDHWSVSGNVANIRSGPGTDHMVFYQAEKYYPLNILQKKGNWYEVKDYEGDTGWIHKSLISNIPSVITIKSKCNIRSGSSTENEILFVAKKGVPFQIIKRKGNWINIRHSEGYEGWIHQSLVW